MQCSSLGVWRLVAEAVDQLYSQGKNLKLVLAGSGPEQDAASGWAAKRPQYASFKGYVKDAGLT